MINISNLSDKLASGLVKITKVNDAYSITSKRFNPETGKEVEPVIEALDIADLEVKNATLHRAVSDIEILINHLKTL